MNIYCRRGLIELLAVIAMISLLLAILLPSLATARRLSKRTVCLSNLQNLGEGWSAYLSGSGGRFPSFPDCTFNYGGRQGIGGREFGAQPGHPVVKPLNTYLGMREVTTQAKVYECPADSGSPGVRPSHYVYYGTSYGVNPLLIDDKPLPWPESDPCLGLIRDSVANRPALNSASLQSPATLILAGDYGWLASWRPGNPVHTAWHGDNDAHNLLFLDGHAGFFRMGRGVNWTAEYRVIPTAEWEDRAMACQQPELDRTTA